MTLDALLDRWPYVLTMLLMLIGLHGMMVKQNLLKKLIAMNIFQAAIILFYVVFAYKLGGTVPVLQASAGVDPANYANPIPHGLMLTAIVVSVATTGVGMALLIRIYRRFGTIDEATLHERLRSSPP